MITSRAIVAAALSVAAVLSAVTLSHSAPVPVATSQTEAHSSPGESSSANAWVTNDAALAILEAAEGLYLQSYLDGSIWRIGYAHEGNVTRGMTITQAQALIYLRSDLKDCEVAIGQMVHVPVTQNEFSALVALCYATGPAKLKTSTTIARLNAGDRAGAADAILLWVKAGGKPDPQLLKVRNAERELFLK